MFLVNIIILLVESNSLSIMSIVTVFFNKPQQFYVIMYLHIYKNTLHNFQAKERLREMLFSQSGVDRWAASQCLAHYGECDSDVVAEIIRQILNCEGAIKYEQGIQLLAKISNSSVSCFLF